MKPLTGLRKETLWRDFLASIDQRFGRIGAKLTPEEMTDAELVRTIFESYKALRETTDPEDPIEPELIREFALSSFTWGESLRKTEVDFFQRKLKPGFPREPVEYQAAITRICEELQAMGVKEPAAAPGPHLHVVADSGPTPENTEAMEYEEPAEEEIRETPSEPEAPPEIDTSFDARRELRELYRKHHDDDPDGQRDFWDPLVDW